MVLLFEAVSLLILGLGHHFFIILILIPVHDPGYADRMYRLVHFDHFEVSVHVLSGILQNI